MSPSTDQRLDLALWSALQGDARESVDHLASLPEHTHWMERVIRYVVQRCLMSDAAGAAAVFGGQQTTDAVLDAETLLSWTLRGLISRFGGDYDDAAQSLVYAVELDANDPWAVGCLALVLLEAGIVEDALHLTTHATAHHESHPFVDRITRLVEAAFKAGAKPRPA